MGYKWRRWFDRVGNSYRSKLAKIARNWKTKDVKNVRGLKIRNVLTDWREQKIRRTQNKKWIEKTQRARKRKSQSWEISNKKGRKLRKEKIVRD